MRKRIAPDYTWPSWRYSPDGHGEIFNCEADVPQGWTKKPGDPAPVFEVPHEELPDHDELIAKLTEMGVKINPIWGDGHMKRIVDGDVSSAW